MVDHRYLKQRRNGWNLQLPVPRAVQPKLGRKLIVQTLKTRDILVAQERRWAAVAEHKNTFARLAADSPLTGQDIAAEARRSYEVTLAACELSPPMAEPEIDPETGMAEDTPEIAGLRMNLDAIALALREPEDVDFAARDIALVVKRTGADIEPGTDIYRRL